MRGAALGDTTDDLTSLVDVLLIAKSTIEGAEVLHSTGSR
jgi:hypothetical protein